jgi:hypothetical protein
MKFLLIQEAGRHEANRNFREALSMQRALLTLGHTARVWGLNHPFSDEPFEEASRGFDVVFLLEQYDQTGWVPDISAFKGPRVFWTVDSHCNLSEHVAQAERQKVTHLLSSTKRFLNYYNAPGLKKYWFPNCYDDALVFPMPEVEKIHRLGFCGNDNGRGAWLDKIDSFFGESPYNNQWSRRDIFVIGKEMVRAINSYKIHFNRNIDIDINYRTFETLGCQTFLLTNYTPGLDDLFDIGKEIVTYGSGEDLCHKIKHYLENPGEREAIAEAGFRRVKRDHTYLARAHQLVELLNAG